MHVCHKNSSSPATDCWATSIYRNKSILSQTDEFHQLQANQPTLIIKVKENVTKTVAITFVLKIIEYSCRKFIKISTSYETVLNYDYCL